jgi:hypothetical protein
MAASEMSFIERLTVGHGQFPYFRQAESGGIIPARCSRQAPCFTPQESPLDDPHRAGFNLAVDDGLGRDALLRDDRNDPTRRAAGPIFHHRPDQSRDGRSH